LVPMLLSLYEPSRVTPVERNRPAEPAPGQREWFVIGWVYILAFVTMIFMFMIPSQTPFFLVDIAVNNPARAGLAIGLFSFSSGIASLAFPWMRRHFSVTTIFAVIFIDAAIGYVLIGRATDFSDVLVAMVVGGFSMGAFFPNANIAILSRTTSAVRGRALSGLAAAFFLGQFASPFFTLPVAARTSIGASFVISGIFLAGIGAVFIALTVIARRRRRGSGAAGSTR
ncbi:MAG: hypothetical protein OER92_01330, partial [Alphaproteobacteria bacterium]|nr:hypothetical protein [Alphaproteobacteria bacterium]